MAIFVVKSINIQINGQGYGSINLIMRVCVLSTLVICMSNHALDEHKRIPSTNIHLHVLMGITIHRLSLHIL